MSLICLNIDFDFVLIVYSTSGHSQTSLRNFHNLPTLFHASRNLALIWTLCSSLLRAMLYLGLTSKVLDSNIWNTRTQVIGWHSAQAEANVWNPSKLPHFWSSGAVHSLITRQDFTWHSGYPQRSSWGVPTASDELYSFLDEHPQAEFEIRIEGAWRSSLGIGQIM